uniref:Uncharacterized protein n=1 Tax=Physcomitrium patens TaxID=3218 RepID=A0A2K1IXA7_PHYPA|nr:hypothetical protein PHYPA_023725 [Physcomitrium patens]
MTRMDPLGPQCASTLANWDLNPRARPGHHLAVLAWPDTWHEVNKDRDRAKSCVEIHFMYWVCLASEETSATPRAFPRLLRHRRFNQNLRKGVDRLESFTKKLKRQLPQKTQIKKHGNIKSIKTKVKSSSSSCGAETNPTITNTTRSLQLPETLASSSFVGWMKLRNYFGDERKRASERERETELPEIVGFRQGIVCAHDAAIDSSEEVRESASIKRTALATAVFALLHSPRSSPPPRSPSPSICVLASVTFRNWIHSFRFFSRRCSASASSFAPCRCAISVPFDALKLLWALFGVSCERERERERERESLEEHLMEVAKCW